MKNKRIIYTLLSILLILLFTNTVYAQNKTEEKYDPNNVLVVFRDNISNSKKSRMLSKENLNIEETVDKKENIELVEVPKDSSVEETLKTLNEKSEVLYAQPNFKYKALSTTNDPNVINSSLEKFQWHLKYTNIAGNDTTAWNYSTGKNVKIAILDTGAYISNPDLSNVAGTYNATNGSTTVTDSIGHGTHVAGITAAKGNNKTLGAGVAYDSNLYIVKVFRGNDAYTSDIINGYKWAVNKGCRVINMSLGGYGYDNDATYGDRALENIINTNYNKSANSVLTVCAAGNGDGRNGYPDYSYPSDYPNSYSVVALQYDSKGNPTRAKYSDYNKYKDIAAPGSNINSLSNKSKNELKTDSGTSMAAPFVSGVAGLIMSANPTLSAKEVVDIINSTANDLGAKGRDDYYGYGEINPLQALHKSTLLSLNKRSDYDLSTSPLSISMYTGENVNAEITITDNKNKVIKTFNLNNISTRNSSIKWDYTDNEGNSVNAGTYKINAVFTENSDTTKLSYNFTLNKTAEVLNLQSSYAPLPNTKLSATIKLNINCNLTAKMYDENGNVIKTIYNNANVNKGNHNFSWNYMDDDNKLIPSGTYKFKISVKNGDTTKEYTKDIKITIPAKASISKVSVTSSIKRNDFNKASIKYTINNQCVTSIKIYNSKGTIVKSISGNRKGNNTEYWNLKDTKDKLVPAGTYKVIISGYNISGKFEVTKYIKVTNPNKVNISRFKSTSKVIRASGYYTSTRFYLNEDARIKVLITSTKNKTLHTIVNKVYKKGSYNVKWNLKNSKNKFFSPGKYKIVIYASNSRNTFKKSAYVTLIKKKPNIKVNKLKSSYKIRGRKNNPTIKVKTNTIGKITVRVYNRKNKLIKTIAKNKTYKTGTYKFKWNGRNGKNKKGSKTKYYFKVTIKNENGSKTIKTKQFKYK
ncbi:S8 family serine peptidase [Anaerofustis stercorihominis]|uniref:S8 family serine peptidase n=1 Tax=Anaerofustis stercorihominis TaxID=214853 RepID=UPI00214C9C0A|nr:S8 family serine peptidase [Anaerofustis stercorihominis]MCR2032993.1 S8 family serine peptidase [Anaerofustis stercorihominis]